MLPSLDRRIVCVIAAAFCAAVTFVPSPRSALHAQIIPHIQWLQTYGGLRDDEGYGILQTGDSGYIVVGYTGDTVEPGLPDYHGGFEDAWVLKLDNYGNIVWEKCLGDTLEEEAYSVVQTKDGGYCIAIRTESSGGEVVPPDSNWVVGGSDGWIVKLTPDHQIQWATVIGGSNWDDVLSMVQSDDGGFVVAGYTASDDGCVTGHLGGDTIQDDDAWVTKLDGSGKILWSKCYGGLELDQALSIVETPDHGFCFVGNTASNDNEVSGNHGGISDVWVAKIDSAGNFLWGKCYGGSGEDWAAWISLTSDSGFIVTGGTNSTDGDVSGNHGGYDAWVLKLSATGDLQWQQCLGGDTTDKGWSIMQTADGGYLMGGMTMSNDDDVSGNHSTNGDAWLVKLDPSGTIQWQQCIGGSNLDVAFEAIQLSNGNFAFIGQTESYNGDVSLNHGNEDMMFSVLSNTSSVASNLAATSNVLSIYPLPAQSAVTIAYDAPTSPATVKIDVRNVLGTTVAQMLQETSDVSHQEVKLDLSSFLPGCYFVTISAPGFFESAPFQVVAK
jgi:hypothetical protein